MNAASAEGHEDKLVHDWNEENNEEGVEIHDDTVWHAVELHCCSLGGEIVRHLTVSQPYEMSVTKLLVRKRPTVERQPEEDFASEHASTKPVYPSIIESHHPSRW